MNNFQRLTLHDNKNNKFCYFVASSEVTCTGTILKMFPRQFSKERQTEGQNVSNY